MKVSGALAWHPDVAMTKEEINDFLSGRWIARLATIGQDGYPQVTPLWRSEERRVGKECRL